MLQRCADAECKRYLYNRKSRILVVVELPQIRLTFPQDTFHIVGSAVSQFDPYDFGRWTTKEAELMEILIFRNDSEPVGSCVLPYGMIGRFLEADISHVFRIGKCVAQTPDEFVVE